ncbi:low affinity immunoglobulin epsilon Fc receptor-like [Saccostrea cucullata]|uniref:low affinity immunoglobulin epsilon Fc receptor-like n=1 Tax=Saccostrea cuccullata TaxID=36930 RepID=UPI002ECFB104
MGSDCHQGWTFNEGHCYMYNETILNWYPAKTWCEEFASYLVELDSQEESDWITNKFLKADVCASVQFCSTWSGGNDITTEGVFIWAQSNAPLVYTNWAPKQPANGMNMRSNGKWNDAKCSDQFKFICEKSA